MIIDIDLSPIAVLVIDQSLYARSVVKSILASFGVRQIHESDTIDAAFALLSRRKVDVVLVERDLLPVSGMDFLRRLRRGEVPQAREVPVIMLSSAAESERVAEARAAGVNEYLIRPVSADSLFRRLRSLLVNPRPFVDTPYYVGPCRRTIAPPNPPQDRRISPPLPKPQPALHVPPGVAHTMVRQAIERAVGEMHDPQLKSVRMTLKAGDNIFREGTHGDCAYVVESGRIGILKHVGDDAVPLGEVGPQGIFGEMALIDDQPRMASAQALEDSVCLAIPRSVLKAEIAQTPDLVILVVETLLHDIRKMGRELAEVRARLVNGSAK